MKNDESNIKRRFPQDFTYSVIRISLIAFLVFLCLQIFAPFANLLLWALILAIALYPSYQRLTKWLGGRQKWAAVLLVITGLLLIGGPTVMLGSSFAKHIHKAYMAFESDSISIKMPEPKVAEWPLVGKQVYDAWSKSAENLPGVIKDNAAQFKNISKRIFSAAANTISAVLLFLSALIISGIMMAYGESGTQAIGRIFLRLTDPETGPRLQRLSTATVRSVATGVIGVAFIQALLLGLGFIMAGIPAAGVLALIALVLGILQFPAAVISLPAIAYLWWMGEASTLLNVVYTIYLLAASLVDNILKPLLLGRGVEAPMPIILIGALGGMLSGGIIGLFVGAVLLAVSYRIFIDWIDHVD